MILPIQSSMFSHIGYDKPGMFLTVRYHPTKKQKEAGELGDVWQYRHYSNGLPSQQPEEGWGRWFLANIRGKYDGEKVIPTDNDYYEKLIDDEEEGLV